MTQTDVEMLRSAYEAINRGNWDAAFRETHRDFELITPDRMMSPGTYRGSESIRQFFEDLLEPFDEVVAQPEQFFQSGNRIVVFLLLRSRPAGSSSVMEIRIGHLWTMRDGKATRLEIFPERKNALEAAGISESI